MSEREKAAAEAEKQYDKEANEAVAAYSRIMRARQQAVEAEKNANKQVDASRSALIAGYGQLSAAALQSAKGIAFLVASNQEEAESFVRSVAAAQGYFDVLTGGIHILHGLNDVQRQSAIFLQAQTSVAALASTANSSVAATGTAVAAAEMGVAAASVPAASGLTAVAVAGAAAIAPLLPFVAIAAVAGTAAYGVYYSLTAMDNVEANGIKAQTKALEALSSAADRAAKRMADLTGAQVSISKINLESSAMAGPGNAGAMEAEIERLQKVRETNAIKNREIEKASQGRQNTIAGQQRQQPFKIADYLPTFNIQKREGNRDEEFRKQRDLELQTEMAAQAERQHKAEEADMALAQQQLEIRKQIVGAKNAELEKTEQMLALANQTATAARSAYESDAQRLGSLTHAQLSKVERLSKTAQSGGHLSHRQEQFLAQHGTSQDQERILQRQIARGEKTGLVDKSPLQKAEAEQESRRKDLGNAREDVLKEKKKAEDEVQASLKGLKEATTALAAMAAKIGAMNAQIEALTNSIKNNHK